MLLSRAAGRLTTLAAAFTVIVVATLGLPRPALAAEPYVGVYGYFDAQAIAIGTAGKTVPFHFGAYTVGGAALPPTVTVKVDVSKPAGVISARLEKPVPGCSGDNGVFTCTKNAAVDADHEGDFALVFTAGASAQVGDRGSVTITTSAPGVEGEPQIYELLVSEPGPDLRARDFTVDSTPGGTVPFNPSFHNQGDRTAETLVVRISGDAFATVTDRFSNCRYSQEPAFANAICFFRDLNLEPGEVVTTTRPLTAKVASDVAGYTWAYYAAETIRNGDSYSGPWDSWPAGTGPALTWERSGGFGVKDTTSDVDYRDNQGTVQINTPPNPSDVVAVGANAPGKVGDTVTVKLGLTNKGPGFINGVPDGEGSDPDDPYNAAFDVTFPAGVEVTGIDLPTGGDGIFCRGSVDGTPDDEVNQPGRSSYRCLKWSLAVDATHLVTFTVKITGSVTTAGSVVARGGVSDPDTANNTAKVEFGGGEGGLPITGVNVALASVVGVLLVAAGFGVYRIARRRRAVFVTG